MCFAGKLQLCADDVAIIYSTSTHERLNKQMQSDLNLLLTWCNLNAMTLSK